MINWTFLQYLCGHQKEQVAVHFVTLFPCVSKRIPFCGRNNDYNVEGVYCGSKSDGHCERIVSWKSPDSFVRHMTATYLSRFELTFYSEAMIIQGGWLAAGGRRRQRKEWRGWKTGR